MDTFHLFFAFAPLVLGIAVYTIAWSAKRSELAPAGAGFGASYACANCGKRSSKEHMLPQAHAGAVSYFCSKCAGGH